MQIVRQGTLHECAIPVFPVEVRKGGVEILVDRDGGTHAHEYQNSVNSTEPRIDFDCNVMLGKLVEIGNRLTRAEERMGIRP